MSEHVLSNGADLPGSLENSGEPFFSSVLLIEDESAHALLISRALNQLVGEIIHVRSGQEAAAALETRFVELVLCDLHLPDVAGLELITQIRNIRPALPIIVLTSSSNLNDAVRAMREGAWDYMVKQFDENLQERIRIVLARSAQRKLQEIRELRLRQERDAFSTAASAARDGLAIISEYGSVLFANTAFRHFCKQGGEHFFGDSAFNLLSLISKHSVLVAESLRKVLSKPSDSLWSSELEIKLQSGDGEQDNSYYYELSLKTASPSLDSNGAESREGVPSLRYNVLWVRDITRRKEQEKFQRDLLSTTTHDLKGPLGAILTSAELISEIGAQGGEVRWDMLTRISSCARNSISIIDELLSARKIQDGVLVVKPRWHNLQEFLDDTVLDYLPVAKTKAIEFCAVPGGDDLLVYADKIGLMRVLGNLVSNALKFTPKGGKVWLQAERVGDSVQISVSDTGPGIDESVQHKLFERFGRLEHDNEIEGSGIGLFVSKNIVQAHNGHIEVKSSPGMGTTFIVSLPDEVKGIA